MLRKFESFPLARRYAETIEMIGEHDYESIVDIGCGEGTLLRWIREKCASKGKDPFLIGVDLETEKLKRARDGAAVQPVKADIAHLPFTSQRFSLVLCNEVLEHIPDPDRGLRELVRIVKEEGVIILSVPVVSWFRYLGVFFGKKLKFLDEREHFREYAVTKLNRCVTISNFLKSLGSVGLRVRRIRGVFFWPDKGQRLVDWLYVKLPIISDLIGWADGLIGRIPGLKYLGRWVVVECVK